jgi:hypothetical protein
MASLVLYMSDNIKAPREDTEIDRWVDVNCSSITVR